jgi:gamma-glutamylaminecyclotransferase
VSFRLFVYGSLRRGHSNHAELAGASFLGKASTAPDYAVVMLGSYPALVCTEAGDGVCIEGELYEVSPELFAVLDEFEGDEYERRSVRLAGEITGELGEALAYFAKSR